MGLASMEIHMLDDATTTRHGKAIRKAASLYKHWDLKHREIIGMATLNLYYDTLGTTQEKHDCT